VVAKAPRTSPAVEVSQLTDLIVAAVTDFNVAAIDEDARRVYFHTSGDRDAALAALSSQFPGLTFAPLDVPDEDWAARSQASLRAIEVGGIVVAPPWDLPPEGGSHIPAGSHNVASGFSRKITIVIQPSMGFGTGHHATTRRCLAALQQLDLKGRRVLDVGTGSGVLAIAASLLGATDVTAIDDDPDAIQAATENVALNPGAHVKLQTVDLRTANLGRFDAVIANLTGGLLVQTSARLTGLCAPAGYLVLSGFMLSEEDDVLAAYSALSVRSRMQEDEWLCVTLARPRD
jgi:ribosomal protein L11 methyltransferase